MATFNRVLLLVLSSLWVTSCGPGPGAPLLRSSTNDGGGPLIPGCSNVSQSDRTQKYILGFYLTTWGSASREGTAAGLMGALDSKGGDTALSEALGSTSLLRDILQGCSRV